MRRREFLALVGGACAAWPAAVRAQERIPRIGYLGPDQALAQAAFYQAFVAGLSDLGYVEGRNIEIVSRFSEYGQESRLTELANELVDLKVDVLVAGGPAAYAAHNATKTIPIVVSVGGNLIGAGLADSLGHPGGNVTGQTYFAEELQVKRVALLKQVKPTLTSVGILFTKGYSGIPRYLRTMDAPLKALGVRLQMIEVSDPGNCETALSADSSASIGGLVVVEPAGVHGRRRTWGGRGGRLPARPPDCGRFILCEERRAHRLRRGLCPDAPPCGRLRRQDPERRKAGRYSDRTGDEVRVDRQSQDRPRARS
jgi:putative tryptophan/tyrosine transport system substrate-binding protein